VSIGDVADVIGGGTPRTSDASNFDAGSVPWITPADLSGYTEKYIGRGSRYITNTGLDNSGARLLPKGTVLFSSRAPIGYVAIARNPLATNQGFKSFVLPQSLDPEYVYYFLQRAKELALRLASGTTFPEISGRQAAKVPLAVAPAGEQHRIVEAIESYFTRLDDAVASLELVQRNLKRYRASVLKAALEGRLVPTEAEMARAEGRSYEPASVLLERILAERRRRWEDGELAKMKAKGKAPKDDRWKEKYVKPVAPDTSELPELPEGWCWASVDQIVVEPLSNGRSVKTAIGGFPVLRLTALKHGNIDPREQKMGAWTAGEAKPFLVTVGDFLVSRGSGSIRLVGLGGLVRRLQNPVAYPDTMIRFRMCKGVDRMFFAHVWNSTAIRSQVELKAKTTAGIFKVNQSDLEMCVIPLPPEPEQSRIQAEIGRLFSLEGAAAKLSTLSISRCARLRQSILKWAFEGRLADQDPTDEPASRLLERIRAERESATEKQPRRLRRPRARKKDRK
jgi:type I restriction enzyme S subunit